MRPLTSTLSISRLAGATGCTTRALRHYEDLGLLAPLRGPAGVRRYTPGDCDRAREIARLRRLDLSLDMIRVILDETSAPQARTEHLRQALLEKLNEMESRIPMLRDELARCYEAQALAAA